MDQVDARTGSELDGDVQELTRDRDYQPASESVWSVVTICDSDDKLPTVLTLG